MTINKHNAIRSNLESTSALGGAATKNGIAYDTGNINGTAVTPASLGQSNDSFAKFRAFASADVAGTLKIQQSRDGSTWYTTTSQPIVADAAQATIVESLVTLRWVRAVVVNGAGAQASFEFDTALVAV